MKKTNLIVVLLSVGMLAAGCTTETSKVPEITKVQNAESSENNGSGENKDGDEVGREITVSCYDSALYYSFIEAAAKQFEQKHPGTKVNVETFSAMPQVYYTEEGYIDAIISEDNPQERADYISKTSTALMSGKGADLLAMDVLPAYKYVESEQLENLKEYIKNDADFNQSDYQENIIDALEFQDGIWFLPLDYSFDFYTYDRTLVAEKQGIKFGIDQNFTTRQLLQLGKSGFDGTNQVFFAPAYLESGSGDLFSQLFREDYRSFVNIESREANFNDGKFKELLEEVEKLSADGYIKPGIAQATDTSELLESAHKEQTERFLFKPKNQFLLLGLTYTSLEGRFFVTTSGLSKGIEDDDQIAGVCAEEEGTVPFTYNMAIGINSNSHNKQLTWEFLKFLLSYEIQVSPDMLITTLPIHNQARTDRAENLFKLYITKGKELDEEQRKGLTGYLNAVETMSDQINGYTFKDTIVQDMVVKEASYFFEGTKSAEQVCQVLQNKVGLYLNE